MGELAWEDVKEDWVPDGGLVDIYVFETTLADWQRVVDVLRATGWPTEFSVGDKRDMPAAVDDIFELLPDHSPTWRLWPHPDVLVNCFFFSEAEIEFDVSPDEIVGEAEFDAVCDLVLAVGRTLGKRVDVTGESTPSTVFMRYEPETDQLVRVQPEPPKPLLDRLRGDG